MTTSIRVADEGTLIRVDVCSDITLATVRKLRYKKPDGVVGEWDATLSGTQILEYILITDDIDQHGVWQLQSYVELPSGIWHGDITQFDVGRRYVLETS